MVDSTKDYTPAFDMGNQLTKLPVPDAHVVAKSTDIKGTTNRGFKPYQPINYGGAVDPKELTITQPKPDSTPDYGWWDTFSRNVAPIIHSVTAGMAEDNVFQPDPNYNADADYEKYKAANGIRSTDETNYLLTAPSAAAFQYRTSILADRRQRDEALMQHPVAGVLGSLVDADLGVGVLLPEVKGVTTLAKFSQRAGYAAAAAGGTEAVFQAQGSANPMTDTEKTWALVGMGASGLFLPSARTVASSAAGGSVDNVVNSTTKTYADIALNDASAPITRSAPTTLPEDVLQRGKPYTSRSSAQTALQSKGMTKTHEIVEVAPNKYVLRTRTNVLDQQINKELESLNESKIIDDLHSEELKATHLSTDSEANAIGDIPIGGTGGSITARITTDQAPDALPKNSIEHKFYNYILSASDQLRNYVPDANSPVHKLLASPYNRGDNVVETAVHSQRTWQYMLNPLKRSIDYGVQRLAGVSPVMGRFLKKDYSAAYAAFSKDFMHNMQILDDAVLTHAANNGGVTLSDDAIHNLIDSMAIRQSVNVDPNDFKEFMRETMKQYVDSKFATDVYDRFTSTKLLDADVAEQIVRRPTYLPVDHSYDAIRNLAEATGANVEKRMDAIAEFLGNQIMRMYPNLNRKEYMLTPKMIGQHFIETQRQVAENFGIRTIGYTKEGLQDLLTKTGKVSDKTAMDVVDQIYGKVEAQTGGVKNFKKRIQWDWNARGQFDTGEQFTLADLVNHNVTSTLDRYTNSMSKRTALAEYGIKSEAALESVWKDAAELVPAQDRAGFNRLSKEIHNSLMGKPVGEDVHPVMRSLQTIAGMMNLANSGIFNLVDLNTQLLKLGYIRSFPHMLSAMRPVLKGMKGFSSTEAKSIEDVLTGKLMVLDSWQPFINRYADSFDISSARHESIEYFGQATRFLNGSEFIKRYQLGLLAGVFVSAFKGAAKGSKSDIKFLTKRLGFDNELVGKVSEQYRLHGSVIDSWDSDVRRAMERKVFHEADNMAHTVHEGEIPELLQYSQVGKIVFPYMRYTFAMTNKMMRKTYIQDGATATAIMMAHQVPMAIIVAGLQNIQAGKAADTDLVRKTMNAMSALGLLSYPIDMVMSSGLLSSAGGALGVDPDTNKLLGTAGQTGGSAPVFTPITKTLKLMNKAVNPDSQLTLRDIKQNTVLNSVPALGILLNAVEEK